MFDRIDQSFSEDSLLVQFFPLDGTSQDDLVTLMELPFISAQWGGHRGKCYTNYANNVEYRPAMGFAENTPCIFDLISKTASSIGTVMYEISGIYSKVKTVQE